MKKLFLWLILFTGYSYSQQLQITTHQEEVSTAKDTLSNYSSVSWGGVAPTNFTDNIFTYALSGGITSFDFHLDYSNAGTLNNSFSFRLPNDDNEKLLPAYGLDDGQAKIVAIGYAYVSSEEDGTPIFWNCYLKKNSSEEYTVYGESEAGDSLNVSTVFGHIHFINR